jgi:hypothetical protein
MNSYRPQDEINSASQTPRRIAINPAARGSDPAGAQQGRRVTFQPGQARPAAAHAEGVPSAGWDLGLKKPAAEGAQDNATSNTTRTILIAGGGVLCLLLVALLFVTISGDRGVILTKADNQVLDEYRAYLKKSMPEGSDAEAKMGQVAQRLKAFKWARQVGDSERAEQEYRSLLLMDSDRSSPLYRYCLDKLKKK